MGVGYVNIGGLSVSRFILGGNPFSGFAHQTPEMSTEMVHYFTAAHIKDVYAQAEELGINTHIGRADRHIMRALLEYWDEGGKIQWTAQTCPGVGPIKKGIDHAREGGAVACFIHGGVMDNLFATGALDEVPPSIEMIKEAGMPAGIACHDPRVLEWAEEKLDCDFYMCSYYNSAKRDRDAERRTGMREWFLPEDREKMAAAIQKLSKPAIHYKVLAAGRNDPREAFAYVARTLRPDDAVCVGIYPAHKPDMLKEDLEILEECLNAEGKLEAQGVS